MDFLTRESAEVHPVIASLRARLAITDEEVGQLIDLALGDSDVMGGDEWDDDAFREWLTDEVWNHIEPGDKRIMRIQKAKGWEFP